MLNKFIAFAVLMAGSVLANPVKPSDLINPTNVQLQKACDEGFAASESGDRIPLAKHLYVLAGSLDDGYVLQSVLGGAVSGCGAKAENLEAKPTGAKIPRTLIVMLAGGTQGEELSEAVRWAAVLSVQDNTGKELVRLTPTQQDEGLAQNWKVNCSARPCVWRGANFYHFDLTKVPKAEIDKASKGTKLVVIVQAGNGKESFVVDSQQIP